MAIGLMPKEIANRMWLSNWLNPKLQLAEFTSNQFAEKFENKCGLGYIDSIGRRISILATKGYIKYSRDFAKFKLPISTSKFGIVCVEGMEFPFGDDAPQEVLPTHFKCPNTGNAMEITDDQVIWSYEDEESGGENE